MNDFLLTLRNCPLFSGITEKEIEAMLPCLGARQESFPKGSYILREGETADSLGVLLSGHALIIQEDFWGNRNIISSVYPGQSFAEAFACASGSVFNISVAAEAPCSVMFFQVKRILTVCPTTCRHHNQMIHNLLSVLASKTLTLNEKITHLGQRSTRAKLLSYLSLEARKKGRPEFDIPFSRQELADYLFVERSGLSSELCKMQKEGLIEFHRNHFLLK